MYPGPELAVITDLMESAVGLGGQPARTDPGRRLARAAAVGRAGSGPRPGVDATAARRQEHLTRALAYIERHLSEPLTVPQIAAAVGVSHNHLTRLFTAGPGLTVVGYLRRRRIEHARQLLVHSTMSISAIASTVGIPDLQAFNKACRTVTGLGPRALRRPGRACRRGRAAVGDRLTALAASTCQWWRARRSSLVTESVVRRWRAGARSRGSIRCC